MRKLRKKLAMLGKQTELKVLPPDKAAENHASSNFTVRTGLRKIHRKEAGIAKMLEGIFVLAPLVYLDTPTL